MARKPIDIGVAADLATLACRFPTAYELMCRYYYAYRFELELFTKRPPASALPPLMPLTNNYVEFEKLFEILAKAADITATSQQAADYLEAIEP